MYPVNIDYWIKLIGPEHTKIILQFQKLDIESQDECLYDYIGLNNIDSVLHIYTTTENIDLHEFSNETLNGIRELNISDDDIYNLANEYKRTSWNKTTPKERHKRYWAPHKNISIKNLNRADTNRNANYTVAEFYKVDNFRLRKLSDENSNSQSLRLCGSHETAISNYNFVSRGNEMHLYFHSDYSITGSGFSLNWNAIDISACPIQTLTAREGFISSPHYPHFLLNDLDCTFVIQAPYGRRIFIDFTDFEIISGGSVEINIGEDHFIPFKSSRVLNDGVFVSKTEKLIVRLQTGSQPRGKGFRAIYRTSKHC